ncbi:hypothetical protein MRX96_031058 [Rhipicephalus microplus]
MLIKVKTLTGKEKSTLNPTTRWNGSRRGLKKRKAFPPAQQRLIYSGKQMNDEKTATDYKVQGGSVLHLVLALRGGQWR